LQQNPYSSLYQCALYHPAFACGLGRPEPSAPSILVEGHPLNPHEFVKLLGVQVKLFAFLSTVYPLKLKNITSIVSRRIARL